MYDGISTDIFDKLVAMHGQLKTNPNLKLGINDPPKTHPTSQKVNFRIHLI